MATGATTNLNLTTVEADDQLPEAVVKANFEVLDQYVAATEMTNKSGSQVTAGDVVVSYTSTDSAFQKTTTASHKQVVGVVQETIADAAAGIVKHYGTSTVKVTGATSRGDWLRTSTTAGKADPVTQTDPPAGAFAIALTSGSSTVTAMLLSVASASTAALTTGAGTDASAVNPIHYDTTNLYLKLWNGSASVPSTTRHLFARKTAETQKVNNSTVLVNDDTLSVAIGANEVWSIDLYSRVISDATADFKTAWDIPAAATIAGIGHHHDSGGGSTTVGDSIVADATGVAWASASAGPFIHEEHVLVTNGANAGTVRFQWAQNTGAVVDTYVRTGSYLVAHRVA